MRKLLLRGLRARVRFQSVLFLAPDRGCFPSLWLASQRAFPKVLKTNDSPNALLAIGGLLNEKSLLSAYSKGVFPLPGEPVKWVFFNPRMHLLLEKTKVQKKTCAIIRSGRFRVTFDSAFKEVVEGCADRKWTWIVPTRMEIAVALHKQGLAHSVEVWNRNNELVGGLFGVEMGQIFIWESTFHRESNAGHVAVSHLFCYLQHWGYKAVDGMAYTPFIESLGFDQITPREYLNRLSVWTATDNRRGRWEIDEQIDVSHWIPSSPGSQVRIEKP